MKASNEMVSAVIVAAGQSTRMGANKMLLELGSMTVFERTLRAFEESSLVGEVVVVSSAQNIAAYRNIVKEKLLSKVTAIIGGGATRSESVRLGLAACSKSSGIIAIHDGARPLIKPDSIDKTIEAAMEYGAAAVAVKSKDTIKIIDDDDFAVSTIDREHTVRIQTPQAFRRDIIFRAYEQAAADGFEGTDDCSLTERIGCKAKLIYLPYVNIKLTEPADVTLAMAVLAERGKLRNREDEQPCI